MSRYDNAKFYWLQLKEDFFESEELEWLQEQGEKGVHYALFYLKLCLKALKTNGILIRRVGNILIPYDKKKLAELTGMDFDTVVVAMDLLIQIGLVEILENGEIFLTKIQDMIGEKSLGAFKKQQQRRKADLLVLSEEGGQMSAECPSKCPPRIRNRIRIRNRKRIKDIKNILSSKNSTACLDDVKKIIDYLNQKLNTKYSYKTQATQKHIKARLKEGFTVDNFKTVIDSKYNEWHNTDMKKYLRPETLFGTKFESYLNNANITSKNSDDRWDRLKKVLEEREKQNDNGRV